MTHKEIVSRCKLVNNDNCNAYSLEEYRWYRNSCEEIVPPSKQVKQKKTLTDRERVKKNQSKIKP